MTAKTLIALDDADGAIVFRSDGGYELKIPNFPKEDDCPDHLTIMAGVYDRLADPLFCGEMIAHIERQALGEED